MTKTVFITNFFKFYNLIWKLALPFLKRNRRLQQGFEKRTTTFHLSPADLWIQAASAGEAYLAVAVLLGLKPETPLHILVTTTTAQGMDILKSELTSERIPRNIELKIDWFPFDMPDMANAAVSAVNPKIMVLLETELWPGLLYGLKKKNTKILMINARMSKKSFGRYLKTRELWKHLSPDLILAISDQDKNRFQKIFETSKIRIMSNIKFESIETDFSSFAPGRERITEVLPTSLPLTVLASVRRQEEKQILLMVKKILTLFPDQVVAIFPRHMSRLPHWEKTLGSLNLTFYRRSRLSSPLTRPGIILWDVFGELKTVYEFASVVFVGGSLKPLGGQNVIEPVSRGAVTITGPYYDDFAWAAEEMVRKGFLIQKKTWKAIAETMVDILKPPILQKDRKAIVQRYLQEKKGGVRQACDEILKAFDLLN